MNGDSGLVASLSLSLPLLPLSLLVSLARGGSIFHSLLARFRGGGTFQDKSFRLAFRLPPPHRSPCVRSCVRVSCINQSQNLPKRLRDLPVGGMRYTQHFQQTLALPTVCVQLYFNCGADKHPLKLSKRIIYLMLMMAQTNSASSHWYLEQQQWIFEQYD